MDQTTRNHLQRATQDARTAPGGRVRGATGGTFDILPDGKILPEPGTHLDDGSGSSVARSSRRSPTSGQGGRQDKGPGGSTTTPAKPPSPP